MTVSVLGGLTRLKKDYEKICKEHGYKVRVFDVNHPDLKSSLLNSDVIVLMTRHVSHNQANLARKLSRKNNILLFQTDKCGLCELECIIKGCNLALNSNEVNGSCIAVKKNA